MDKNGNLLVNKKIVYKIKSLMWEGTNKLIFNTHEHINYLILNGEMGIIRSINKILFLLYSKFDTLVYFNINEELEEIEIDKSELIFKTALLNNDSEEV